MIMIGVCWERSLAFEIDSNPGVKKEEGTLPTTNLFII